MSTARKPKPHPPASYEAHRAAILAIDPGEISGWALFIEGTRRSSSAVQGTLERAATVAHAQAMANTYDRPLVIVAETWPRRMGAMRVGAFASWQGWKEALSEAKVPARRVVRVQVGRWSAAILGGGKWKTTEQRRAASIRVASAQCGVVVEHDEAAAICIGLWASKSGEVANVLPKPRARAKEAR